MSSYMAESGLKELAKALIKSAAMIAFAIVARGSGMMTERLTKKLETYF